MPSPWRLFLKTGLSVLWVGTGAVCFGLAPACMVAADLTDKTCSADGECLEGYRCDGVFCVVDSTRGSIDAGIVDVAGFMTADIGLSDRGRTDGGFALDTGATRDASDGGPDGGLDIGQDAGPRPSYTVTQLASRFFLVEGQPLTWQSHADGFSACHDGFAGVSIPFPFEFAGRPVTTVWVSNNGFVSFGDSLFDIANVTNNQHLPEFRVPNAVVALWWSDLYSCPPDRHLVTIRTSDNGTVFHIAYVDVLIANSDPSLTITGEIRLYKDTNVIDVHYGTTATLNGGLEARASGGWEGFDGTIGEDWLECGDNCRNFDWPDDTIFRLTPTTP